MWHFLQFLGVAAFGTLYGVMLAHIWAPENRGGQFQGFGQPWYVVPGVTIAGGLFLVLLCAAVASNL